MIKIGTDCSGIEAPIQAFKRLNIPFKHLFSSDIDKHVKNVVTNIYKPSIFYDDLMIRDNSTAPSVNLYIAGFPCQAFSMAGKRKGFEDIRGSVFFGVADYIKQQQPEVFILENVKGLLSHEKGRTFQTILDVLAGNGTVNGQMSIPFYEDGLDYNLYWSVMNTKEHGIPQNRERVFLVGFKDPRAFSFPIPEPLTTKLKDVLEDSPEDKYYLSDKILKGFISGKSIFKDRFEIRDTNNHANCLDTREGSRRTNNFIKVKTNTKKGYEEATENDTIRLGNIESKTARGRVVKGVAQTLETQNNQAVITNKEIKLKVVAELDVKFKQDRNIYDDSMSPCLRASKTSNHMIRQRVRRLTPLECFRLQDFSDEFHDQVKALPTSDTQLYKMSGNSMTVRVIEKILRKIYT